ncbi:MAG: amino-acid N-acetyltransferase [Verrucomicrobiae bacterium]|nr:amino-acid N-acetyltransferase [Verrucomicrobiae bacterium]
MAESVKPIDLRSMLRYIPQFRDKVFVLSVDGQLVSDENFPNLLRDVAVLWSLNIKVVICHGASYQMRELAAQTGVKLSNDDGTGVTDAETLKLALTAANRLTHEILEGLSANDLRAATTNACIAHPVGILQGVDHLYTGKIERVDTGLLTTLLEKDIIPVCPPLGFDGEGHTYRVNSDQVAIEVAEALKAVKLIFLVPREGLIINGQLDRQILATELAATLKQHRDWFLPEQISKAEHAVKACQAGIERVHVINGRVDEAILAEVFSSEGIGTMVHAYEYRQIRKASKKDLRAIQQLIKRGIESDELVKRTRATLERELGDYFVYEVDKNVVACVACHWHPELKKAELACLFVHPLQENMGIGRKLVNFVEARAAELGANEVFALSTQAFAYFQKLGYTEGTPDDLPPARRERYEQSGRKSKILIKKVAPAAESGPT